jgi:integrase
MNEVLTTTLKAVKLDSADGEKVFSSRQGTSCRSFRTAFERAVHLAGIVDFTFHDLRHPGGR